MLSTCMLKAILADANLGGAKFIFKVPEPWHLTTCRKLQMTTFKEVRPFPWGCRETPSWPRQYNSKFLLPKPWVTNWMLTAGHATHLKPRDGSEDALWCRLQDEAEIACKCYAVLSIKSLQHFEIYKTIWKEVFAISQWLSIEHRGEVRPR